MKLSNLFSNPPALAKYLFILLAALLVYLAFASFKRVNSGDINQTIQFAAYAFMMFIDAAVMLLLAFRIGAPHKRTFQLAVAILILNVILTVFYQIGVAEILFVLLNAAALYILFTYRKDFTDAAG
jgi:hypothetical protein